MAESGVECFSGVKTAQKSKTEGGIERIKHENVKLKEENVPGAILPREKPEECTVKQFQGWPLCSGRMHCETASEIASLPPQRKRSWIRLAFLIL